MYRIIVAQSPRQKRSNHFVIAGEQKRHNRRMKYWKIIGDNLSKAGWSWGCISAIDSNGQTIWIADSQRDDGKHFVARANEKLTAFRELASAIRGEIADSASCPDHRLSHIRLKSNRQDSPRMLTVVVLMPDHTQDFSNSLGDFCNSCEAYKKQ